VAELVTRRHILAGLASFTASRVSPLLSFWVFGLLKPTVLHIYPQMNSRLHCHSSYGEEIIEGNRVLRVEASSTPISVTGADRPVLFLLEIPGVLRRRYLGNLTITSDGNLLRAVVSMDREVAVSSIVGAELPLATTPLAALAAQAVAVRSFLCAARYPRHGEAQFCDTTHCQFLRAPAAAGSPADQAVRLTHGLVLKAESSMIPAQYSAACGGRTDSAEMDHYRYRSVICEPCRRNYTPRRGHGLGLCQTGAIGLAQAGWRWQEIAGKYYPGLVIGSVISNIG